MKKILTASAVSLCLAAVPVVGVFAEGNVGENTHSVTVGEVTEPIYSVDITWGDMSFDWAYNTSTESYGFKSKISCDMVADGPALEQALQDKGNLYSDTDCEVPYTGDVNNIDVSQLRRTKGVGSGKISVVDKSTNGKITPETSFTPTANYNWVIGKFGLPKSLHIGNDHYLGFDSYDVASDSFSYDEFEDNKLFEMAKAPNGTFYEGYLYLENNAQLSHSNVVSPNDVIGTVTVTISPDTN